MEQRFNGFTLNTIIHDTWIIESSVRYEVNGIVSQLSRQVIRTQDKQIRDALISLGWTPPLDSTTKKIKE